MIKLIGVGSIAGREWPGAWEKAHKVSLLQAQAAGCFLLLELQPQNKKVMSVSAFLREET